MPRTKAVSDDRFIEAVAEWPKDGKLPSTGNLRDQINDVHGSDYDRKTVYRRLDELEKAGEIKKIEVGRHDRGRSIGWAPNDLELNMVANGPVFPKETAIQFAKYVSYAWLIMAGFYLAQKLTPFDFMARAVPNVPLVLLALLLSSIGVLFVLEGVESGWLYDVEMYRLEHETGWLPALFQVGIIGRFNL